jgi:hypothetical protein
VERRTSPAHGTQRRFPPQEITRKQTEPQQKHPAPKQKPCRSPGARYWPRARSSPFNSDKASHPLCFRPWTCWSVIAFDALGLLGVTVLAVQDPLVICHPLQLVAQYRWWFTLSITPDPLVAHCVDCTGPASLSPPAGRSLCSLRQIHWLKHDGVH